MTGEASVDVIQQEEPWMNSGIQVVDTRKAALQKLITERDKLRKQPGNCTRCGKPHTGRWKTCDTCRLYRVNYHKRKRWAPINLNECERMLQELGARVLKLENKIKGLKLYAENSYQRGYAKGRARA
jgi:hypothetical protein